MMPQCGNYEGRRRGARHNTCKANGQALGPDLVNGAVVHNDCPAAAAKTNENGPAGAPNGTKPLYVLSGYTNHSYKDKRTKAVPPRAPRKQDSTISAATDASAAVRVHSASRPGGISVSRAAGLDAVPLPCDSDQMAAVPRPAAASKRRRGWKKFRHKKRTAEDIYQKHSLLPPMPPQQSEDWESDIQEVKVKDWSEMCFGDQPFSPEDVISFALRGLTLNQTDQIDLPVTANYRPVIHHQRPIKWSCFSIPTEQGQFSDADE